MLSLGSMLSPASARKFRQPAARVFFTAISLMLIGSGVARATENSTGTAPEANPSKRLEAIIKADHTVWSREYDLGQEALGQGYVDDAIKHLLTALRELKNQNIKDERLLKTRNLLGKAYIKNNNYLEAGKCYTFGQQTAHEMNQDQSIDYAKSLEGLATVYAKTGQPKKAEELYKQSLKVREAVQGTHSAGAALCLLELAELLREQKLYADARPVYELAIDTLNNAPDATDLSKAYFLDKIGTYFLDQGKMPEAHSFFTAALALKDRYSTTYAPVDSRKRGQVYYRCENGMPNCAHAFNRGVEVEAIHVKDMVAVSTLTAQIYGPDWYLLKAEVTVQNQGKTAISALAEQPTLTLESPKQKTMLPLDSDAIANELSLRGQRAFNRLLHSADYDYVLSSFTTGGVSTVGYTPFGPSFFNTAGTWATFTPDWDARARARNAAFSALRNAEIESAAVIVTKPAQTTIQPGQTATFVVYYPYNSKFKNATLRMLFGNSVLEFPFTSHSG